MSAFKTLIFSLGFLVAGSAFAQEKAALPSVLPASLEQVDLNTATVESLTKLKGIGEKKANDILAWRAANSCFASVDELKNIKGIGEKTLDKLRPFLKAEGCTKAAAPAADVK